MDRFFDRMSAPTVLKVMAGSVALLMASWDVTASAQAPRDQAKANLPAAELAPSQRVLKGDDARRAKELDNAIEVALKADHWDEAIARAEDLLALRMLVQGPKHYETVDVRWHLSTMRRVAPMPREDRAVYQSAQTMTDQAADLLAKGNHAVAQPLLEKALEIRRLLLSDEYPETATSCNNVAYGLIAQGKYAQSQPLLEKGLEIYRRLLTDDHPHTATGYNNLAMNLNAQGKYAQAQPFLERALEIRRRVLAEDHLDTALSYNNLAFNLNAQGRYAQAQPVFEKGLKIYLHHFGDNHRDTATVYNNLAANLKGQGKYAEAQPLYEKALEIRRRLLSDDHPETGDIYSNLAMDLNAQGKYVQAQPLYEKALEIHRRLLTDDHPDTARSYNNLAINLNAQGKYAEAQPLLEKALEIDRHLLSDNHPSTASGYSNLAYILNARGKYVEAQPLLEKALEIRRRLLSDDHPDTAKGYNNVAGNLQAQGKYAEARPLYEKALEIRRRRLTDDHPDTASSYNNVAYILEAQGRYAQAQPLYEKALEINHRLLTDDHPQTANSYGNLADNLNAQGKYLQARDRWLNAVKSLDATRRRVAFSGLERAGAKESVRPALAALLARLGQPAGAWQVLEEHLGRGLLDELAARRDQWLPPDERARLRELTMSLERLDRLVEATPSGLDQAERAQQFEDLKRRRSLASIALGEFQAQLFRDHGARAGQVASLSEIQAVLPADAALVAWVDIKPTGPNAADPDGEHWGVVVRSRGIPAWLPIAGTGPNGLWTNDDTGLAERVRTGLRSRPGTDSADPQPLVEKLRLQRLAPLAKVLDATADGQPAVRRLVVLPSRAMAGIPFEVLLAPGDTRVVNYAPSATVFRYLREQPRPDRHAGLLALGDPVYKQPDKSSDPKPLPEHGLLVNVVARGSNAETRGLKHGDVLLAYNGSPLKKKEDLKVVAEGDKPIPVDLWRDGRTSRRDLAPGPLGVVLDPRPAPEAVVATNRAIEEGARGGPAPGRPRTSPPCPAPDTRSRRSLSSSSPIVGRLGSCSGPTRVSPRWTAWPHRENSGASASSTWRHTG